MPVVNDTVYKFIKFSVVGFVNTVSSYLLFFILLKFLGVNYLISSISGYLFGIVVSYFGNKYWTFQITQSSMRVEFTKFVILNLIGMTMNALIMAFLVEIYNLNPMIAQVIAMSLVIFYNFFGSKYWVFKTAGSVNRADIRT